MTYKTLNLLIVYRSACNNPSVPCLNPTYSLGHACLMIPYVVTLIQHNSEPVDPRDGTVTLSWLFFD